MTDYTPKAGDSVRVTVTADGTVKSYDPTSRNITIITASGNNWSMPLGAGDNGAVMASAALLPPTWTTGDVVADKTSSEPTVYVRVDDAGAWKGTDGTTQNDTGITSEWQMGTLRPVSVAAIK